VAARGAGLTEIRVGADTSGVFGSVELIALADLYSPKLQIGRWVRGRDFLTLVQIMADPLKLGTLDPIVVMVVPERLAKYLTPLAEVVVNPI
jgi:hypothetical protein